jgi:hypothetical protein
MCEWVARFARDDERGGACVWKTPSQGTDLWDQTSRLFFFPLCLKSDVPRA